MVNTVKTKKESPSTYLNNIKPLMTLSDRLKLAGIKEYKPNIDKKPVKKSSKSFKKRKSTFKITTMRNAENSTKDFSSKNSTKNEIPRSKITPKNTSKSSPKLRKPINRSAANTISESLNFIKDCQNYKSKLRSTKEESRSDNQSAIKEEECEKSQKKIPSSRVAEEKVPVSSVTEEKVSPVPEEKIPEKSNANENTTNQKNNNEKLSMKETVKIALKSSVGEIAKMYQKPEITPDDLLIENVSKIDKSYLESLLSLANSTDESKNKPTKETDNAKDRKKKSTTNSKVKTQNDANSTKDSQNNIETEPKQSKKDQRIVRDSTKSEAQIQLRVKKHGSNQKNSETKMEKDLIHSKPEVNDGRKKRKPRMKNVKNNNEEVIEVPFSFETSKTNDVKELWRREALKKSENSLTSHSSCTIPENDVIPNWKNLELQSYRILQKLVEEEINKISKKSENKNNTGKVKNEENNEQKEQENKPKTIKDKIKSKNNYNKMKLITPENATEVKKTILKENLQNFLTYEGEKNKSELLNELVKNNEKNADLKLPEGITKKCGKTPEQIVQNWSILNRLEQAFLALGTPTFQDEKTEKTKQDSNSSPQNTSEPPEKVPEKKEQETKNKSQNLKNTDNSSTKKTLESSTKTKLNESESVFPKKKPPDSKFPFRQIYQIKDGYKRLTNDAKNSNDVQTKKAEETLERKGTFDVIPVKNSSVVQPQKSKSCNKIDSKSDKIKKRFLQTKKQEPDFSEKQNENEPNKDIEKKEEKAKPPTLKNQQPKPAEKASLLQKNYKSGIPKLKFLTKTKFDKKAPTEEVPKPQTPEKKEPNQNPIERPVKGRSILSMRGIQTHAEKLLKAEEEKEEKPTRATTPLKSSTGDMIMKIAQKNYEELIQKPEEKFSDIEETSSFISILETDLNENKESQSDNSAKKSSQIDFSDLAKKSVFETSDKVTSVSSLSQNTITPSIPTDIENLHKHSKLNHLSSWERDIYRYREIVNDIMNQYKRIDGFLKHSEQLGSPSVNMITSGSSKTRINVDESMIISDEFQAISLQEYRKKIETEYQKLPFFEYKQQKREESKKRNLSVVTEIKKEMDFDVKDYQPNVKKVLDSQLYVDTDNLFKRNESERKVKDKKSSLQELQTLDFNNRPSKKQFLRCNSVQKTVFMPDSEIYSVQSLYRRDNP